MGRRTTFTDRDRGYARLIPGLADLHGRDLSVEVGIFEDAGPAEGGGLSLAELAALHEFGSADGTIPARPFIRQTFARSRNLLAQAISAAMRRAIDGAAPLNAEGLLLSAGDALVAQVRETILAGLNPPNAASTLRQKRGTTPLIDTGRLLASISARVVAGSGGGTTRRQPRRRPRGGA